MPPITFNNFQAGNAVAQDETTAEMLEQGLNPRPNWVFSPKFTLDQLREWVNRQIDLFDQYGQSLAQIRIKNPGQGVEYTAENIWAHISVIRDEFSKRGKDDPIVYLYAHDFNGRASHELKRTILMAQQNGFPYVVTDVAVAAEIKSFTKYNIIASPSLQIRPD